MTDVSSSETTNPAVLRFRGLNLEAMTALQIRNIEALRRMSNLLFDNIEAIAQRQAAFLQKGADKMSTSGESGKEIADPNTIFKRQVESYQVLANGLATHLRELTEINSNCCASLVQEATGNFADLPSMTGNAERPEKSGCCTAKSNSTK